MNIIMSLIPPKLMKLANLFGFHGDRRVGLQALEFASDSQDMKAPLARCVCVCACCVARGLGECIRLISSVVYLLFFPPLH